MRRRFPLPALPRVALVAHTVFVVGIALWFVGLTLYWTVEPSDALVKVFFVPAPVGASALGLVLALDVHGSARAFAAAGRKQKLPLATNPAASEPFVRFLGALFLLGGPAFLVMVLVTPIAVL